MAAKDSEPKQWTDPKDYGLPFVEITPIRGKSISEEKRETEATPVEVVAKVEKREATNPSLAAGLADAVSLVPQKETHQNPIQPVRKTEEKALDLAQPTISNNLIDEKKSSTWIWAVVVIGLGIVAIIVWQILAQMNPSELSHSSEQVEESPPEDTTSLPKTAPESTLTEQNQITENQDSIVNQSISNPNISKPAETGTTIANRAVGNLIRIESKAERPQYFIIVGSLPNEKLAIEEANQYFGRSSDIYLISPEEGSKNYRLALSKFGSFRLAAEELERIKSQYTEELWILKY